MTYIKCISCGNPVNIDNHSISFSCSGCGAKGLLSEYENQRGWTFLRTYVQIGDLEATKYLLDIGVKMEERSLIDACYSGRKEVAEFLIQKGADLNFENPLIWTILGKQSQDNERSGIIQHYINLDEKVHLEIIKTLVNSGADVNFPAKEGQTALHFAAEMGYYEITEFLVNSGADVNVSDNKGRTPIYSSMGGKISDPNIYIVELLLNKGAQINAKTLEGRTPIYDAVIYNAIDTVKLLIDRGADVNVKTNEGLTPLHMATFKGNIDIFELLLNGGADINVRDSEGLTISDVAEIQGSTELVCFLKTRGGKSSVKKSSSSSSLSCTAVIFIIVILFICFQLFKTTNRNTSLNTPSNNTSNQISSDYNNYYLEGINYYKQEKYDIAVKKFETAIELNPNHADSWNEKGYCFYYLGKSDLAIKSFERAISINPNFDDAWNGKGICFKRLGKEDIATKCFEKAIEINPNNEYAKSNISTSVITHYEEPVIKKVYSKSITVSASDNLPKGTQSEYYPNLVIDGDSETAWNSSGVKEKWIKLSFDSTIRLAKIGIIPGYDKIRSDEYGDRWYNNNRLKEGTFVFSDGSRKRITFDGTRGMKYIEFASPVSTSFVKLEVNEVYIGKKYNDTCISEIEIWDNDK